MPIITKISSGKTGTDTVTNVYDSALNMAKSLAEAIGGEYKFIDTGSNERTYYITMDVIGYPGWCFVITGQYAPSASFKYNLISGLLKTNPVNGSPNWSDVHRSHRTISMSNSNINNDPNRSVACVMICDENKDTVLFDLHLGAGMRSLANSNYTQGFGGFTLFFAKDVKGGVLCGLGRLSGIDIIRNGESAETYAPPLPQYHTKLQNILHLTKMVNYLDEDQPEMKSAYISVVRPIIDNPAYKIIPIYNVNGEKWATFGYANWLSSDASKVYFPLNPIVKY